MTYQRRLQIRALAVLLLAGLAMLTTPKPAMANTGCEGQPSYCFHSCLDGVWELNCPDGQVANCYELNYVCDEFVCPVFVTCDVE